MTKSESDPESVPAAPAACGFVCLRCGATYEAIHPPFPVGGLSYNYARPDDDPAYDGIGRCARCGAPLSARRAPGAPGRMA
jgi:DNA-directed RNA polymerase subunit RPC12/RpoP